MCTYHTEFADLEGSAKGKDGWFSVTRAAVYVDHPYHAQLEHSVNIDFTAPELGPAARVAVELTEESARALVAAIEAALAAAPPGLAASPTRAPATP
ncbi:DUF6295 family protein [Actinocorallia sp. A-T 12471]|uniref:DUF6295 family protein n=1 Tax=Actinocorallia sp. A-T 12471 TaxID=3089813 RepID=UPI0029D2FEF9|nr:DUF6295 family protein [Actinocorallia sp. A-T 12471]MDX6744954.1 DUF6295 family protein [Actinocorallia sp. A-T 12471]